MKKLKFLDLFAGTQSFRLALSEYFKIDKWELSKEHSCIYIGKNENYEITYMGVDIESPVNQNYYMDMSNTKTLNKLLSMFKYNPSTKDKFLFKPDFVWASPVCNKLSLATAMKGGHNAYFKLDKENKCIEPWHKGAKVEGAKNYQKIVGTDKSVEDAFNTLDMFAITRLFLGIINIPFVIENPQHSLTKYIMKGYIANTCSYCRYGFSQRKNTVIYSDRKLDLLKCNHKGEKPHKVAVYGKPKTQNKILPEYKDRAAVPSKLISSILEQML